MLFAKQLYVGVALLAVMGIAPARGADANADLQAALKQLAGENAATRQEALDRISEAVTKQFQQTVALQKICLQMQADIAAQMALLTNGATPRIEPSAATPGLLDFSNALSNFGLHAMALPEKQRDQMLAWGLKKENVQLVGEAFSRDPKARMQGAQDLSGAPEGGEVNWVLTQLLRDPERAVCLTTLDALISRKPSPEILDALWEKITWQLQARARAQRGSRAETVVIQGKTVQISDPNVSANNNNQDLDVVSNLLIHYNDPSIKDRMDALFVDLSGSLSGNNYFWQQFMPNYNSGGREIMKLVVAFKPAEAVPFFARLFAMPNNNGNGQDLQVNLGGQQVKYHTSNRLKTAYLLIIASGQDPETYNIEAVPNYGNEWGVKGTAEDEAASLKKLEQWWKEHEKDYPSKFESLKGLP
jgi:hypothetical protein